jgi:hypothetical protein
MGPALVSARPHSFVVFASFRLRQSSSRPIFIAASSACGREKNRFYLHTWENIQATPAQQLTLMAKESANPEIAPQFMPVAP